MTQGVGRKISICLSVFLNQSHWEFPSFNQAAKYSSIDFHGQGQLTNIEQILTDRCCILAAWASIHSTK